MADTSHILIVDDDPDIRKVLFFLLKDNYFVEEAADGASGDRPCRAGHDDAGNVRV